MDKILLQLQNYPQNNLKNKNLTDQLLNIRKKIK